MSKQSGHLPSTTGTPVHYGQTVRASAEHHRYTGTLWANSRGICRALRVHRYTMGKQSGHLPSTTGTPVHYGQTVRASAEHYGSTGTLCANSQGICRALQVHRYTMGTQSVFEGVSRLYQ